MARYSDAAEGGISMNWDYLRTQGNFRYDNYSRFLLMFVLIFVLLIMLGSVSLIYSAFSISVSERTRQFGLLASIGATRAQLRRTVYAEAGTVALIGIPLGLLAGCGGMWVTIRLLSPRISGMIGAREVAMRFAASPLSPLAAALIALATVFPLGADPGAACHAHFAHRGHPPEPRRAAAKTRRLRPPELPPVRPAGPAFQPLFPPQP